VQLVDAFRSTPGPVLVVTGAGISLASGIPTFRGTDPGAVWKRDVTELGTYRYFRDEPEGSWRWYLSRFDKVLGAQPNPGHTALVALERWCESRSVKFLLVTQNIDGLHAMAGSTELVEVHGAARKVRCASYGCEHGAPRGSIDRDTVDVDAFRAEPTRDRVPKCPACGDFLRQHVLWFDEMYNEHDDYQWKRVLRAAEASRLVLFVGTSFSVGVTELVLSSALERGAPVYSIDPVGTSIAGVISIAQASEKVLPELVATLAV
jgi:NAD-dependent deacetylase